MKKRRFLPIIGIALFLWIIASVDMHGVLRTITGADPYLSFISALLVFPIILTKALKWKILIKSYKVDFPLLSSAEAWLIGFFLGLITPGRIGEISRAYYLRIKRGVSAGKSITTIFIDRIVDITVLFFLAIAGLGLFMSSFTGMGELWIFIVAFFAIFLLSVFFSTRRGFTRFLLKPVAEKVVPEKYRGILSRMFHEFYSGIGETRKSRITQSVLVCLLSWSLSILQYYLLARAIGIQVPFSFFLPLVPVVVLLDTLPVSFSGIGTRDAALIFFFSLAGLAPEAAVSLSLLVFLIAYLVMGLLGALLWVRKPMKLEMVH